MTMMRITRIAVTVMLILSGFLLNGCPGNISRTNKNPKPLAQEDSGVDPTTEEDSGSWIPNSADSQAKADSLYSDVQMVPTPDGRKVEAAPCGPSNCQGCCSNAGQCVGGADNLACGNGGSNCLNCTTQGTTCKSGGCVGCTPKCNGKLCGSADECGSICKAGSGCCTPNCQGKTCGSSDGCEGICKATSGCLVVACLASVPCKTGNCSYGNCCAADECGWGDDGLGGPRTCAPNNANRENQWLKGVCRNGTMKAVFKGWGCGADFSCDQGTCINNYCLLHTEKNCSAASPCAVGTCNNTVCCGAGECGWGDNGPGGPPICVPNNGYNQNEWLVGVCRVGTWKTVLRGWGCNGNIWPCDQGTCKDNICNQ